MSLARHTFALSLAAVLCAGCRDKPMRPTPKAETGQFAPIPAATAKDLLHKSPDTVLAVVDGTSYTLADAQKDIDIRIEAARTRNPSTDVSVLRAGLLKTVIDQFVMRTLLLNEAKRRGVQLTETEEKAAFDRIAEQLPPGETLEEFMASSPMGTERMRDEVISGVLLNKLFEQALPKTTEITPEEIAAFRKANQNPQMPESVSASHILMKVSPDDTEETKASKREKLAALRGKLIAGADFAELAKVNSECPSAARGGNLGTFRRGQMVEPFEEAAFTQEPGKIGDIVETKFGYHIIRVDAHHEAAEVPDALIVKRLTQQRSRKAYDAFVAELRAKAEVTYPASEW